MEPPPLQSSEIVSATSISALSPSNDDNQPKVEKQQDLPTQNPSFPLTDSDPVQNLHTQTLELKNLDPQSASSSRRPGPGKCKKGSAKKNWKYVAVVKKKVQTLSQKFKVIPFIPSKALDISRHENNLRKLGLWDFAHLEFDKKIRVDLLTQLIATYDGKNQCSYVEDVRIRVGQTDLGRALNLVPKKPLNCGVVWPADFILFLEEFVLGWTLLHEDTWILPSEVMHWTALIKEGSLEKLDFGKLIWFMVKRELMKGVHLEDCYYASHLQHLIKMQKEGLLMTKIPDEVDEILVVKDDEKEVTDVIMTECDEPPFHGGELEMNPANVQPNVDVQSHQSVENVGEAKIVCVVVHGDGLVENLEACEFEKVGDPVESVEAGGYHHVKSPETNSDHVKNLDTPGNLSDPEKADEDTKDWETVQTTQLPTTNSPTSVNNDKGPVKRKRRQSTDSSKSESHTTEDSQVSSKQIEDESEVKKGLDILDRMVENNLVEEGTPLWCFIVSKTKSRKYMVIMRNLADDEERLYWMNWEHERSL